MVLEFKDIKVGDNYWTYDFNTKEVFLTEILFVLDNACVRTDINGKNFINYSQVLFKSKKEAVKAAIKHLEESTSSIEEQIDRTLKYLSSYIKEERESRNTLAGLKELEKVLET